MTPRSSMKPSSSFPRPPPAGWGLDLLCSSAAVLQVVELVGDEADVVVVVVAVVGAPSSEEEEAASPPTSPPPRFALFSGREARSFLLLLFFFLLLLLAAPSPPPPAAPPCPPPALAASAGAAGCLGLGAARRSQRREPLLHRLRRRLRSWEQPQRRRGGCRGRLRAHLRGSFAAVLSSSESLPKRSLSSSLGAAAALTVWRTGRVFLVVRVFGGGGGRRRRRLLCRRGHRGL